MEKLTNREFALSSKLELWNKIKSLENQVESLQFTILCNERTFQDLYLENCDLNNKVDLLTKENMKLLSQLSSQSTNTINFN